MREFITLRMSSLVRQGQGLVTRGQAAALLTGLSHGLFAFNFAGIEEIGQDFSDEVFRVYPRSNPDVTFVTMNTTPAIDQVIQRANPAIDQLIFQ